ncbi:hypothetical protein SDC9_163184 [bioreactor metagenome]|uniref:Uncharacterized protein n=1 Tax=bioreactor metagenome TaxID=1076179 RepID=A0A645FN36_9ZZZZ
MPFPRVPRAIDARRAVQRVHDQAAVVRKSGGKAGKAQDLLRLLDRVCLKGVPVFYDVDLQTRLLERLHIRKVRAENLENFAHFMRIVRR